VFTGECSAPHDRGLGIKRSSIARDWVKKAPAGNNTAVYSSSSLKPILTKDRFPCRAETHPFSSSLHDMSPSPRKLYDGFSRLGLWIRNRRTRVMRSHRVSKNDITLAQYEKVMGENPRTKGNPSVRKIGELVRMRWNLQQASELKP
jgi:hypothetical protein